MDELVKEVVKKVYNSTPSYIEEIKDKGKNNFVFKVIIDEKPLILRISRYPESQQLFEKEKWCSDTAIKVGVDTPKILEVGSIDNKAFSFQDYVEGVCGIDLPDEMERIWFALGQLAKTINQIPADNIVVNYSVLIEELFADNYFVQRNIFSSELSEKIYNRLNETIDWKFSPGLCHGNLHPSNVIIGKDGKINLIDWETATGNYNPSAELSEIYTWNTGKNNVAHFLSGYGLDENSVKNIMRNIQTLILLRLVSVIKRKIIRNQSDEWKQDKYIQETLVKLTNIDDYNKEILFIKNIE